MIAMNFANGLLRIIIERFSAMSIFVATNGRQQLPGTAMIVVLCLCCGVTLAAETGSNQDIIGSWKGGRIQEGAIVDVGLRLLSIRPDNSLALSMIYELGPRSRVWELDIDVTREDDEISWLAHRGKISANGDTIRVTKEWNGETTQWLFVRDRDSDDLLNALVSCEPMEYKYEPPDIRADGWVCDDMQNAGIESSAVIELIKEIRAGKHGDIHSIIIARHGRLVLEE
jgi:hypothetical protein